MAASASASAGPVSHRFRAPEGVSFHDFLKGLGSAAEKETAMVAKRWEAAAETEGLPGRRFEVLEDGASGIRFQMLWAASAPDHRPSFLRICPSGVRLTVRVPLDSPMTAPKFEASLDAVAGPIPGAALCKAMAKVCNDRAYKVCADAVVGSAPATGSWPVRAALATLDKGMGTIVSVLGARSKGGATGAPPPAAPASGAAAAPAGPAADAGAVDQLLALGGELDAVEAAVDEAASAVDAMRLRGLAAKCGEVMSRLDGIACGPRGSPARQLRKEMIVRAERIADNAERIASTA